MTSFRLEYNDESGETELVELARNDRDVIASFRDPVAASRAERAVRVAYQAGRRDEGVVRAAAFRGLMAAAPLA
jgi:hypothetical protein